MIVVFLIFFVLREILCYDKSYIVKRSKKFKNMNFKWKIFMKIVCIIINKIYLNYVEIGEI